MNKKVDVEQNIRPRKVTTSQLTLMAVMIAARIVLSFIPSLNFGNLVEIGLGFVGTALSGILFGPFFALLVSTVTDLITFFISGSGFFFPGFTLSAALGGWIYGWVLWRKPISWKRVFVAVLLVTLIINLGMNSVWIRMMYGRAWAAFMPMRIVKNLISLPINTIILTFLFKSPTIEKLIKKYQF